MAEAEYVQDEGLAALPGIRHGFFTRNGGVSEGIYATLNIGAGSDDKPENVRENRRRVAAALGVPPQNLLTLYQVHSAHVVTVEAPLPEGERPQADGMVTAVPGLALGILTADCVPVLFADPHARVVGACHAGWKGAVAGIVRETVEAMEKLGAKRECITAAIGPCIGQASYEVGPEFHARFLEEDAGNACHFVASPRNPGHWHFDIGGYVCCALQGCGVTSVNVLAKDTCLQENAFYSNRRRNLRGEPDYGRQVSAIMLLPE